MSEAGVCNSRTEYDSNIIEITRFLWHTLSPGFSWESNDKGEIELFVVR